MSFVVRRWIPACAGMTKNMTPALTRWQWRKCDRRMCLRCERRCACLRIPGRFVYTHNSYDNNSRNAPTMTRTPTTSVTAIANLANAAACAFAWEVFLGERLSGHGSGMLPPLLQN